MGLKTLTVCVTGAGSACGVNIIHSLRYAGGYRIVGTDIYSMSAGLFLADKGYVIPKEGLDGCYIDALLDICKKESVQALIPGFDAELPYLSAARKEFVELGVVLIIGDSQFVGVANDKLQTQNFLRNNGFPNLRSYTLEDKANAISDLGFPLVVKPRALWGSRGFQIVWDEAEVEQAIQRAVKSGWEPIMQEYISDDEGEFTNSVIVATDHEILGSICMRRELEKGDSRRIYIDYYPGLQRQIEAIAGKLGSEGPINLQCRLSAGRAYVFEFNARFSTTNIVRTVCGFNEVDVLVKNFLTGEKTYLRNHACGVAVMYLDYVYASVEAYRALQENGHADRIGRVHNALARETD